MPTILAHKTVSMTDLREPAKVLKMAENSPVALLNRNTVVGYFVPASAVDMNVPSEVDTNQLMEMLEARLPALEPTLDYLKDK